MQILIFGDICPAWGWKDSFEKSDIKAIFGDVMSLIEKADFVIGNFECPATDCEDKTVKTGPNLKAHSLDIKTLRRAGFSALSLANNHINDYGQQGVLDTLAACHENDLLYFGAGQDSDEAGRAICVEIDGKKIGFLSFAEEEFNCAYSSRAGANRFDPYSSLDVIRKARERYDRLIVLYHGGIEHYRYPSPLLQKKCRAMVTAGADLVLCQHSHCVGTQELYNGRTILYGQGNSIFGYNKQRPDWNRGLIVSLSVGNEWKVDYIPIVATPGGLSLANKTIVDEMLACSERLNDKEFLDKSWTGFCTKRKAEYMAMLFAKGRVFNKLNRMTNNLLVRVLHRNRKIAMNMIRCDAHREVVQTILEQEFYVKK